MGKKEKIAKRALKLISFDKDVKVLYNIALENEDAQAEYDAIVVALYGIFVIEVKNWAAAMRINERGVIQREDSSDITYDLLGRISIKEGFLSECHGDLFTTEYQGIVFFSNKCAKVQDDYRRILLSFGGSIVYDIREYGKDRTHMSLEQVNRIVEIIMVSNEEQKTISKVDSEAIIEDYAALVVMFGEGEEEVQEEEVLNMINVETEEAITAPEIHDLKNAEAQRSNSGNVTPEYKGQNIQCVDKPTCGEWH